MDKEWDEEDGELGVMRQLTLYKWQLALNIECFATAEMVVKHFYMLFLITSGHTCSFQCHKVIMKHKVFLHIACSDFVLTKSVALAL
mgnify:CR=1 FL=1